MEISYEEIMELVEPPMRKSQIQNERIIISSHEIQEADQ